MNFVDELRWRGMIHNISADAEEILTSGEMVSCYLGVDPTASSLTIGNLAAMMMLMHLQRAGHRPIALVGGATGRVGDPSGKSAERTLMTEEQINANLEGYKGQMSSLLIFDSGKENDAMMVNNYDWFKDMKVLDFLRNVGKHLTLNYMIAKDSVKSRMETGISFTEFSYQLIQGYDFQFLYENYGCRIQLGGSDQWGNMTAGMELIRRTSGGKVGVITCPLITKADGSKFGKSEGGNVWLSAELTSPYKFYQFWLNTSDDDVKKYIRIFTFLPQDEILALEKEQAEAPHLRVLQKRLAKEITTMIHGEEAYNTAIQSSQILFGKGTKDTLLQMPARDFLDVFEGVPQFHIGCDVIEAGVDVVSLIAELAPIYKSKGEARRNIKNNAVSINKEKVTSAEAQITSSDLLNDKYLLIQKGKKNYNLVIVG